MDIFKDESLKYGDVLNTDLGKWLWEFLNDDETKIRMETATYLKRPALEAVQPQLHEKFKNLELPEKQFKRYKQLIGIMAKRVLLEEGYVVDEKNKGRLKVRAEIGPRKTFFSTATRYKKAEQPK